MKHKNSKPKPKQASYESPHLPEVKIICRLDSRELRDLVKRLHNVRTPNELVEALNSYLDAIKGAETSYNRKKSQHETQRTAIKIRTQILENNPDLDLPKITKDDDLFKILNWCADVQSIVSRQPKEQTETDTQEKDEI